MNKRFVLDACAFIAYLDDEQGAGAVETILLNAPIQNDIIIIHAATVAEVYYDCMKRGYHDKAVQVLKDIENYSLQIVSEVSMDLIKAIGYFKTKYKVSFADTFVLATAKLNNATIVTSDHHEFNPIEASGELKFEWIR